jgi:tetratricopeptide (TPR) repeat protein
MRDAAFISALALVTVTLVASVAEAGEVGRFRPAAPGYVVLKVPANASNDPIAVLEQRHAREPWDEAVAAQLAELYVARARAEREPRYFARAEALVKPWVSAPDAAVSTPVRASLAVSGSTPTRASMPVRASATARAATLRVQADILQNRHDFASAMELLDRAIAQDPRDASTRLMRASIKLVGGHAAEARADCAAVLATVDSTTGTICLAQVLGATGGLARAERLLRALVQRDKPDAASPGARVDPGAGSGTDENARLAREQWAARPAPVRAWALWVLADFADRAGDSRAAESWSRAALEADASSEGIRSALSDLLLSRGAYREALALVDLPAPSIGLLARRARAQQLLRDPALEQTRSQIDDLVALATRRGDPPHLREEALVALDIDHDALRALELAKANFATQRETIDIRLLIRAARACNDTATLRSVTQWIQQTGYEDRQLQGAAT